MQHTLWTAAITQPVALGSACGCQAVSRAYVVNNGSTLIICFVMQDMGSNHLTVTGKLVQALSLQSLIHLKIMFWNIMFFNAVSWFCTMVATLYCKTNNIVFHPWISVETSILHCVYTNAEFEFSLQLFVCSFQRPFSGISVPANVTPIVSVFVLVVLMPRHTATSTDQIFISCMTQFQQVFRGHPPL